jgi:hypothetical protein
VYVVASSDSGGPDGSVAEFQRNRAPGCSNSSAKVVAGQKVAVPLTCTELDGDPMTRSLVSSPGKGRLGSIDQAAGTVAYTAPLSFSGKQSFGFAASDGGAQSATATATITVAAVRASGLRISPKTLRPTSKGGSVARRAGATVSFKLSGVSAVRFKVQRPLAGRRVGKRCRAVTPKNRSKHRCTRYASLRGSFTVKGKAGKNRSRFTGRLSRKRLRSGRYRLLATPLAGGAAAKATSARFRVSG